MRDLRYALRTLARQPAFALVAVTTLAVGIGASAAIFSLLYQILLRPLPYPDAERLVFVWNSYPGIGLPKASVSIPDYLDRRKDAPAVEDATLFTAGAATLAEGDQPELVRALSVTPSFFSTLRRSPLIGRPFTDAEAVPGAARVAILTHGLWTTRFGADRSLVGRNIRLNGEAHTVVGVLPPDFELPSRDVRVLTPFAFTQAQMSDTSRGNEFSSMIARLKPGATPADLDAQMSAIVRRVVERLPDRRPGVEASGFRGQTVPLRTELVGDTAASLYVLQAGVLMVLLIACVNVANLLLMRATGRGREMAIRTALGAGRWRLVRQMLNEALVVSALGGAAGLALAYLAVRLFLSARPSQVPDHVTASLDPAVLGFAAAVTALTAVVFGLVPAFSVIRGNSNALLKDDATRGSAGKGVGAARATLVVAETALALVLLVGAGLLIKSVSRLQDVDAGFSADNVLTAQVALPSTRYPDAAARRQFWERLIERARALPGVEATGLTSNIPFNGRVSSGSYSIVGRTLGPGEAAPHGRQEVVGADYFTAMSIPLVSGRFFTSADTAGAPPVVIIDRYLVNRYFAGRDPIGQQIRRGGPTSPPFTIVGVVGTINSLDLGEPVSKERLYYPVLQAPQTSMGLVLKTARDPQTLVPAVRAAVRALDPEQPVADLRTMQQWMDRSLDGRRTPAALLAIFGAVALALSAVGIYGVLAFGVAERQRELGIRQALGADRRAILFLVLREGTRTAGSGLAIGLVLAVGVTRYLNAMLFAVGTLDPTVFGGVALVLLGVALGACYLPARRATKVDPAVALRRS
jgi:predicted permease